MKKLILSTLSIGLALSSFAQKSEVKNASMPKFHSANELKLTKKNNSVGKADLSSWYSHFELAQKSEIGGNLQGFVAFLRSDSLAKYISSEDEVNYGVNWISYGAVLDPKDALFDLTAEPNRLSPFNSYKLDSIRFTNLYVRNVNTMVDGNGNPIDVVDTLYISYFRGAAIKKFTLQNETKDKLALVDWNRAKRMAAAPFKVDTIFLTANDSTSAVANTSGTPESSWRSADVTLPAPAGLTVDVNGGRNADNLIGVAFTFRSAVPTILNGDTAIMVYQKDPSTLPAGAHRANYYGFSYLSNSQGNWTNPTYYNTSLLAPKWSSYVPTKNPNGTDAWDGFLSGNAFTSDLFVNVDFLVSTTSNNVSTKEVPNSFSLGSAFPNPATNDVTIAFNLKNSKNVKVTLVNLLGQEVMAIANDTFAAGANEVKFNVNNLNSGVYFYTMTVDGVSQSQKIMVK